MIRRLFSLFLFFALTTQAIAALSPTQLVTLKADIAADPEFSVLPLSTANAIIIANAYNATAAPDFTVWKTSVPIQEVGQAFNASEVAGLTTANTNRLQVMAAYSGEFFNPSKQDIRDGFDDIFAGAGGTNARPALLALWKRLARRIEKLYATGTGSNAAPATLVYEGTVTFQEVINAITLP